MKAKITQTQYTGKICSNRKEKHFYKQYTAINKDLNAVIELRLYQTQSTHYCCVWVHDRKHNIHISGGGKAGGYGYHRASEASENALNDAGIILSEHIGGRGDSAIVSALSATMNALGFRKHNVLEAHC